MKTENLSLPPTKLDNPLLRVVSTWGLLLTVGIFGLTHIVTTVDLFNAAYTTFIFLILGLIFKTTRSSYGPMLAWTLINGQVWFMARLLFM